MKRIVTGRYKKDLGMTVTSNEYAYKHPEQCLPILGLPIDLDYSDNLKQVERELQIDSHFAGSICKLCLDCIYFDTLYRNEDGAITCKYIKSGYIFHRIVQSAHCRMKKTSISDLSEFEQYIEKQKNGNYDRRINGENA